MRFFLASTSPRRRDILLGLGLDVTVVPSRHAEETNDPGSLPPRRSPRITPGKNAAGRTVLR